MRYLPVFVDLAGRRCLVVGGGEVAVRKLEALLSAGACVTVVAPEVAPEIERLASAGAAVRIERRGYRTEDLTGIALAFAATGDASLQQRVAGDATAAGVWLNAVDEPERCSFVMPAIVERGAITVAVSTGGSSPALARVLRRRIEAWLGPEYPAAAEHLGALRRRYPPGPARRRALERLLESGLIEALRDGDAERVDALTSRACAGLEAGAEWAAQRAGA